MKCEKCRTDITVFSTFNRGRHARRRYECPTCGGVVYERVSTIPNYKRMKFK